MEIIFLTFPPDLWANFSWWNDLEWNVPGGFHSPFDAYGVWPPCTSSNRAAMIKRSHYQWTSFSQNVRAKQTTGLKPNQEGNLCFLASYTISRYHHDRFMKHTYRSIFKTLQKFSLSSEPIKLEFEKCLWTGSDGGNIGPFFHQSLFDRVFWSFPRSWN